MTEPDVALTDYGLAIECALFTTVLFFRGNRKAPVRPWFTLFFASTAIAALSGGTVHGFFLDADAAGHRILWPSTLIAIGGAAMAAWSIGARLWLSERGARRFTTVALLEFLVYSITVLFFTQTFFAAMANYLPAAVFLLIVLFALYCHMGTQELIFGVMGLALTFIAAVAQHREIALHPTYFNHNALYHTIQGVALFMIFRTAHWIIKQKYP
jgi:hypothetical protein